MNENTGAKQLCIVCGLNEVGSWGTGKFCVKCFMPVRHLGPVMACKALMEFGSYVVFYGKEADRSAKWGLAEYVYDLADLYSDGRWVDSDNPDRVPILCWPLPALK